MNGYKLWEQTPNTICEGARVFTKIFHFETKNDFKERMVRVYVPSSYDFNNPSKRFKTIYMLDGKNLFDDYTSFVGEWGIDETIESMIHNGESDGYIVIGIDAPNEYLARAMEMSPDSFAPLMKTDLKGRGYASLLAKFIFEVVKPDIDATFYTLSDKEHTGVCGSSSGGMMSFYLGLEYPDKIKYCINFSPAFFLYSKETFYKLLDERIKLHLPKQFFYVGGVGFEEVFVRRTFEAYEYFLSHGYSINDVKILYDKTKEHNEKAWREYFPIALKEMDQ